MRKLNFLFLILFATLIGGCNESSTNAGYTQSLERSTPEAVGISSDDILRLFEKANEAYDDGIELHSMMIVRHGKVVAEGWWSPYRADLKHTMYSLSKSFASTAIGLAIDEGKLKLTDKVISFFPEYLPDTVSSNLAQLNVHNLLTMSVGQTKEPGGIRFSDDWVKVFLSSPVENEPGSVFHYNSASTFMLSAIINKVTGENLIDYLSPRLFEPLGIEGADWEMNPQGISTGGWGLRIKTEDIAKLGQLYLQKGKWGKKQILSEEWVKMASSKQIETKVGDINPKSDWEQGYGYQLWQTTHNSFRGDGAYGQYMIVMPEKDVVVAVTANVSDMQKEINLIWDYLYPAFKDEPLAENADAYDKLTSYLSNLSIPVNKKQTSSVLEKDIEDKEFHYNDNSLNITSINLGFENDTCKVTLNKGNESYNLVFGNGDWLEGETSRKGPSLTSGFNTTIPGADTFKVAGTYSWIDDNQLELVLRYIESPNDEKFLISFAEHDSQIEYSSNYSMYKNKINITGKHITQEMMIVQ